MNIKLRNFHTFFTTVLIFGFFFSTFSRITYAQPLDNPNYFYRGMIITVPYEHQGLTFEFFMNPGETKCDKFKATNDFQPDENGLSKPASYFTMASDFILDPENGVPTFPEKSLTLDHKYSLASWVKFDKESINLKNWGDSTEIGFCVSVPQDATGGSHYAALLLSNLTKEEYLSQENVLEGSPVLGTGLGSRLGPNLIVNVSGEVNEDIAVSSMKVVDLDYKEKRWNIFEFPPIKVLTYIKNSGTQLVKPSGNIFIHKGDISKPIKTIVFNRGNENEDLPANPQRVLPDSTKLFENNWNPSSPIFYKKDDSGNTTLEVSLEDIKELKFGKYYATLQMTYTNINGEFVRSEDYVVAFWIIPLRLILFIILLILIFLSMIYYKFRKQKFRNKKK